MNRRRLAMATAVGMTAIATLTLLWLLSGPNTPVTAGPAPGAAEVSAVEELLESPLHDATPIHYVATTGTDDGECSTPGGACLTIQYAVDQAGEGDEIRVASGSYTGVSVRPRADVTTTGVVTQVVYISKTVAIRGGYTTTNNFADPPDPAANPTTLDAQEQGRVLYITGDISPTVEGLRITGGNAAGLIGGTWNYYDVGGGAYIYLARATISDNWVYSNTADVGGGLHLLKTPATLSSNTIMSNTAITGGGGLGVRYNSPMLSRNTISGNRADQYDGGGVLLYKSNAVLVNNILSGNTASNRGGGLYLLADDSTLSGNIVYSNSAAKGGGLYLDASDAILTNNLVAENQTGTSGSGLWIERSSPQLLHTTIAHNTGGDGSGLYINNYFDDYSRAALTNTILVSHSVAINVRTGNTATLEATLWGDGAWANGDDWAGDGRIITGTVNVWGDPVFVDPDAGDYHIGLGSAAIDAGVDAGVAVDIDGELRPVGPGYDIGADEFPVAVWVTYLPLVLKGWPPIPCTPVLNPIDNTDQDGYYAVTWQEADLATTYILEEATNASFSGAQTVYQGTSLSWTVPDPGKTPGTYYYRAKGRNSWGDSSWSNVQSTVVGQAELFINGGFETGPPAPPWVQYSNFGLELIDHLGAHTGSWGIYMGGLQDAVDQIYQEVTIPSTVSSPQLSYWRLIRTSDSISTAYDEMRCVIWDTSGNVLAFCGEFSNVDQSQDWIRKTYNMSAFRGRTVHIGFKAFNDGVYSTQFFIDDVSLSVTSSAAIQANQAEFVLPNSPWRLTGLLQAPQQEEASRLPSRLELAPR